MHTHTGGRKYGDKKQALINKAEINTKTKGARIQKKQVKKQDKQLKQMQRKAKFKLKEKQETKIRNIPTQET